MESKKLIFGIIAVIAAVAVFSVFALKGNSDIAADGGIDDSAHAIAEPQYPEMAAYPDEKRLSSSEDYDKWRESVSAQQRDLSFAPELQEFYGKSIISFLSDSEGENKIISPLNIYMALSMLSEVTDGESREEIMSLINCPDVNTLRQRASDLWNAHYRRDGATSLTLANSLWLRNGYEYNDETLKALADNYYASSYKGEMGSEEYDQLLRNWLSEQSEGLLENSAQGESFDPSTVLALASSVCYRAKWGDEFDPENTEIGTFHSAEGDKNADFMHRSFQDKYFWGENFGAVSMAMENGGGSMQFILPDEGTDIDTLLSDAELMNFILSDSQWENNKYLIINLALPKFDVESELDLIDGLKSMGVKKVFNDAEADFSSISDADNLYLSKVKHAARVAVDEEGVKAAAYTVMACSGDYAPPEEEIDFSLDRPFIFVIKSQSGQPLFTGIVNKP